MAATTSPSDRSGPVVPARLVRFDRPERALHWATALLFLVLMVTAAALYVAPLSALVGRRGIVRLTHLWAGLALPLPYLVARAGPWSRALRADVARLAGFDPTGKFHPLQRLNASFTAGAIAVMLGTGSVMYWFEPFPLAWRTGATFVHDWLALALFATVAVHVAKALGDTEALGGMWHGRVSRRWARRHHPRWAAEAAQVVPTRDTGDSQDRSA